jgi:hypothetical protein
MSGRGSKLLKSGREIDAWKAGKTKAAVWIDGKEHSMTIDEFLAHRASTMTLVEQIEAGDFNGVPDDGNCCVGKREETT